jgi:hypothetical protein
MNIKSVLDTFSEQKIARRPNGQIRTDDGLCPLQIATDNMDKFVFYAYWSGLSYRDCCRIITWADTGRWPTVDDSSELEPLEAYGWFTFKI